MIEDDVEGAGGFADLTLAPELCNVLSALGYEEPTPIQLAAIPPLLEGSDLVGQAATGTGKTAAFALPVLQRLLGQDERAEPFALVLVPTRELAIQVAKAMLSYGHDMGARVLAVYGGEPISRQLGALKRGVDVVVATPGRALDHINRGTLNLGGLEIVVLDEADEMLDMGFAEEIEAILASTPEKRQTALFSATAWFAGICAARCESNSVARRRSQPRDCSSGRLPTWCRAGTRRLLSAACLTWRGRRRRSSSAAPGKRWTSSPNP
jgi:ATP-dependent RNA helicase DeaD